MCVFVRFRGNRGFTLLELLVVVGVMSLLIALLLPALSRARESARRIACSSNLRQLGWAFLAYAQDSRGWFPAPADGFHKQLEDWVYWQPDRELSEGRLFQYLNRSADVLACPSGVPERRAWSPPGGAPVTYPPYPFSYSVNVRFTGHAPSGSFDGRHGWSPSPCKLSEVFRASEKILAVEEDVIGINDGAWWSLQSDSLTSKIWLVSVRHDAGSGRDGGELIDPQYRFVGRGNVVFADGHCEFLERRKLYHRAYADPRYRDGMY